MATVAVQLSLDELEYTLQVDIIALSQLRRASSRSVRIAGQSSRRVETHQRFQCRCVLECARRKLDQQLWPQQKIIQQKSGLIYLSACPCRQYLYQGTVSMLALERKMQRRTSYRIKATVVTVEPLASTGASTLAASEEKESRRERVIMRSGSELSSCHAQIGRRV